MDKYKVLKKYFGYEEFREGQEFLIDSILEGKNVVGVMPTGAGKSICYQLPALLFEGITIVISPLISLMKDQVFALTQAGVKAAFLNSSLTSSQYYKALENARAGIYKIIYVAPERLLTDEFLGFAREANIEMVTIDEAHCISQWGQDFRPSYVQITDFIEKLTKRPVVSAFTATATKKVRDDIIFRLKLTNPVVLLTGFDRGNLFFSVEKPKDKANYLLNFLEDKKDSFGIVYCATRKEVDKVHELLSKNGYLSAPYHAGLSDVVRGKSQDDFIYDRVKIVVATNAFGMGIDKSNVTFVVHYNMPKNMESYYQEAGRAGRDGSLSQCLLLYGGRDVVINSLLIENGHSEYESKESEELIKDEDRKRLKQMTFYCHTTDCLREYILKYFGETPKSFCGNCSNCSGYFETVDITVETQKILSCVVRLNEGFGVKMVIDVLKGSKNQRILEFGFDKLSVYGISDNSEKNIHNIINYLILNNYLMITMDKYPVLKLGNCANEILRERKKIEMKLSTKVETYDDKKKDKIKKNSKTYETNSELFEELRILRLEIATKQKVPAFVIFSDSTLKDMCVKLPKNERELLLVSGVGEVKLEKYGGQFLEVIKLFADKSENSTNLAGLCKVNINLFNKLVALRNEISQASNEHNLSVFGDSTLVDIAMKLPTTSEEFLKIYGVGKAKNEKFGEKFLNIVSDFLKKVENKEEILEDFNGDKDSVFKPKIPDEDITLGSLTDFINCFLLQRKMKKVKTSEIISWLINKNFLEVKVSKIGENYNKITKEGIEIGLKSVEKTSLADTKYFVLLSTLKSSEFVLSEFLPNDFTK